MSQDIERWLKRFQPPEPPPELRRRIFGRSVEEQDLDMGQTSSYGNKSHTERHDGTQIVLQVSRPRSVARVSWNARQLVSLTMTVGVVLLAILAATTTTTWHPVMSDRDLEADATGQVPASTRAGEHTASRESDRAGSTVPGTAVTDARRELVACVVGLNSAVWRDEAKVYLIHDRLRPGDRLCLESGRVELVFDCGVQMVLEGPAELEILGEKHARMAMGIVTARAWSGGEGFTVDTPQVNIVDLSTEFGVKVDAAGKTDLAVFEGAIDVFQPEQGMAANADEGRPERLLRGDVIRYGGGGNETKELKEFDGKFRTGNAESFNIIEWHDRVTSGNRSGVNIMNLDGIVVDAGRDDCTGDWICSRVSGKWVGDWYYHDMNDDQGPKSIRFAVKLPKPGLYEVRMAYSSFLQGETYRRASNVPVDIEHSGGAERVWVDQREEPPIDGLFVSLGVFHFGSDRLAVVTVRNQGADGFVTADAIQFLPVE